MVTTKKSGAAKAVTIILAIIVIAVGIFMLAGGIYLISLDGSWYFAPTGLVIAVSGVLLGMRRPSGAALYLFALIASVLWSVWEVGFTFWPLISRLFALSVLALFIMLSVPLLNFKHRTPPNKVSLSAAGILFVALIAAGWKAFIPQPLVMEASPPQPVMGKASGAEPGAEWLHYGRTPAGTRFADADQITPENVSRLNVAWTYRTGEIPKGPQAHVVTPLFANGMLYGCTHSSQIFALNAETGKEIWHYNPHASGNFFPRCRGVAFYDASTDPVATSQGIDIAAVCRRRVISTTVDARIVALDAQTGKPCEDFGEHGIVDLHTGMGTFKPGFYFPTAAPTVVRNLVVVGGLVQDNHETGEPSGVIRAFDVHSGKLVWAWDLGNPAITALPPQGEGYTPGTPNVWSTPAYDDKLGLIYLPTGNATPDFWGGHRTPAADKYSSSVVALDITTGRERWHFQTVHHDRWDYDVPSQPALYDVPDGKGGTTPALIQTTKRGEIFMLDRRTGVPIAKVEERPVPQGGVSDDRSSPTQPYSVGMPSIGTEPLKESRMWGMTPLDQLVCRIEFRQARYEGEFTPPSEKTSIFFPGWAGGMNWGSSSIAENRGYLLVNDSRMAVLNRLVRRQQYDATVKGDGTHDGGAPQYGTPWGVEQSRFLSPLGIPCQEPPYGTLTAIDLATRKIVWSVPMGTVEDTGPLGIAMHLPLPVGLPTLGGPVSTASGLVFMAGTQDYYIRALDIKTGKELWKGRLPVGGETTPMTYTAQNGRQYVVISAGGNRTTPVRGDYIIAFALPQHD
ncbi:TPA: membrane-bound PQQ-dependent dehydrogenase, glucose/quinate/shikimate family [Yersinia enterocolitica]|nr:membrane-bound PQQ-dependent dehydrogenase, glucose/quinate/shikimate family [Yersinia enterocolitica]HEN3644055.1 membrane-bound PQQ-dependent dehydrogenase, glucose/quinate/shikimate family [Yersinia enterocolitica]